MINEKVLSWLLVCACLCLSLTARGSPRPGACPGDADRDDGRCCRAEEAVASPGLPCSQTPAPVHRPNACKNGCCLCGSGGVTPAALSGRDFSRHDQETGYPVVLIISHPAFVPDLDTPPPRSAAG